MEASGLNKGRWTLEEDEKLRTYIEKHGIGFWRSVPAKAGLQRSGKGCRLRWTNYLQPDIEQGKFSMAEELTIIQLHALLGNRWSAIARHLPKRTENEIKNYWETHLKQQLAKKDIDPITHEPRGSDNAASGTGGGGGAGGSGGAAMGAQQHVRHPTAHLRSSHHTAQWESARLEAEAREHRCQANQLRALVPSAASASLSAPPAPLQMPTTGPVAAHRVYSPTTSTLSMSLVSENATALASVLQEAHSGFAALTARATTQLQPVVPAHEQEARRKDGQLQQQRWGDHVADVADADNAAAAFAGVLLDESEHQEQTEVEKKYWVFIMNLVSSSPSSASSSLQR